MLAISGLESLPASLTSGAWWLSVVVVGILIHVIGMYAHRGLERTLSKSISWFGARSKAARERRATEILTAGSNEVELILYAFERLWPAMLGGGFALIALIIAAIASFETRASVRGVAFGFSAVCLVFATMYAAAFITNSGVFFEARGLWRDRQGSDLPESDSKEVK